MAWSRATDWSQASSGSRPRSRNRRPRSNHAIMPVYVFSEDIFTALSDIGPGRDGELQLTDAIQRLVSTGQPVIGVLLRPDEIMLDLGSPETMIQALRLTMQHAGGKDVDAGDSGAPVP